MLFRKIHVNKYNYFQKPDNKTTHPLSYGFIRQSLLRTLCWVGTPSSAQRLVLEKHGWRWTSQTNISHKRLLVHTLQLLPSFIELSTISKRLNVQSFITIITILYFNEQVIVNVSSFISINQSMSINQQQTLEHALLQSDEKH